MQIILFVSSLMFAIGSDWIVLQNSEWRNGLFVVYAKRMKNSSIIAKNMQFNGIIFIFLLKNLLLSENLLIFAVEMVA